MSLPTTIQGFSLSTIGDDDRTVHKAYFKIAHLYGSDSFSSVPPEFRYVDYLCNFLRRSDNYRGWQVNELPCLIVKLSLLP
jgi:hypothetical protein